MGGIEPPPFGEEQMREITEKTSLTRDNIEWARQHWADDSIKPDQQKHGVIAYDMLEMYKKGVSFATINLWIDYYSGADTGSENAFTTNRGPESTLKRERKRISRIRTVPSPLDIYPSF